MFKRPVATLHSRRIALALRSKTRLVACWRPLLTRAADSMLSSALYRGHVSQWP